MPGGATFASYRSSIDDVLERSPILGEFLPVWGKRFDGENDERELFRLPKTNVNETDKEFVLTMEMPGVEKKNIDVALENDKIIVTGEKSEKPETQGLLRREIRSEKFRRSFSIDNSVDRDAIKAKLEHGVLKVTLSKKAESVGRKVSID